MFKIPSEPPASPSQSRDTVSRGAAASCKDLDGICPGFLRSSADPGRNQPSFASGRCRGRLHTLRSSATPVPHFPPEGLETAAAAPPAPSSGNPSATDVLTEVFVLAEQLCPNLLLSPLPAPCCLSSLGREARALPGRSWRNSVGEHSQLGEPHSQPHPPLSWCFPLSAPRCQLPAGISWLEGKKDCHCPSLPAGIPLF